jgi:hypothetical protein
VLQHEGGGVAPWNVQQYDLHQHNENWSVTNKKSKEEFPLIFFHFHHLKFFNDNTVHLSYIYDLKDPALRKMYVSYIKHLQKINQKLKQEFAFESPVEKAAPLNAFLRIVKVFYDIYRSRFGTYNVIALNSIK